MTTSTHITVRSLEEMKQLAAKVAANLKRGDIIAFNGTLGAGKTTFIQMLCAALGVSEKVVSPTFVLVHQYLTGRLPVIHADLYRLGPEKSESLRDEILAFADEGLVLVEWAEYGDWLEDLLTLTLDIAVDPATERRDITLTATRKSLLENLS